MNTNTTETLVLLHGLGSRSEYWLPQMELVDTYDRVITLDLLGHGHNKSKMDITLDNMALNVFEQLDEMGIQDFHVGGISMGGMVAQTLIRQDKNRIKSLILANTLSFFPFIPTYVIEMFKPLKVDDPATFLDNILKNAMYIKTPETIEQARKGFKINPDTYTQCAESGLYVNFTALMNGWEKPTLILTGSYDTVVDKAYGYQSYMSLPCSNKRKRYVELKCGHLSSVEMSGQFNDEIRKFFNDYC